MLSIQENIWRQMKRHWRSEEEVGVHNDDACIIYFWRNWLDNIFTTTNTMSFQSHIYCKYICFRLTKVPYDLFCPKVFEKVSKSPCTVIGTCFPPKKTLKRHKKIHLLFSIRFILPFTSEVDIEWGRHWQVMLLAMHPFDYGHLTVYGIPLGW